MLEYRSDIKLIVRYIIIGYLMYLCWYVIQPSTLNMLKGVPDVVGSVIIGSPYGAFTLVLKAHFDSKIDKTS